MAKAFDLALMPDPDPTAGHYYRSDHFSLARAGVPAFSIDEGRLFEGHHEAWGRAQFADYVAHHYHQPADEFRADWDFRGDAKLARFGFVLGWMASEQTKSIEWHSGDEFEAARKASKASAVWTGSLKEGKGTISTATGVLSNANYSFATRFEGATSGTTPEELIAAAHAQLKGGLLRRIANGVAEHVFNRSAQQLVIANYLSADFSAHVDSAISELGFNAAIVNNFFNDFPNLHRLGALDCRIAFNKVDFYDVGDKRRNAIHIALDAIEGRIAVRASSRKLRGELQPCER